MSQTVDALALLSHWLLLQMIDLLCIINEDVRFHLLLLKLFQGEMSFPETIVFSPQGAYLLQFGISVLFLQLFEALGAKLAIVFSCLLNWCQLMHDQPLMKARMKQMVLLLHGKPFESRSTTDDLCFKELEKVFVSFVKVDLLNPWFSHLSAQTNIINLGFHFQALWFCCVSLLMMNFLSKKEATYEVGCFPTLFFRFLGEEALAIGLWVSDL